jgi:hypothetical protein
VTDEAKVDHSYWWHGGVHLASGISGTMARGSGFFNPYSRIRTQDKVGLGVVGRAEDEEEAPKKRQEEEAESIRLPWRGQCGRAAAARALCACCAAGYAKDCTGSPGSAFGLKPGRDWTSHVAR